MPDYKTLRGTSTFTYEEKRSRFIATAAFADTDEKALAVLNAVRAANRTARHNVYAYVLQNGRTRYSDDGEPAKTAGTPVLETIGHAGVSDVIVVVTRYFGGILLGMIEQFSKTYISTLWSDAIVFGVLVLVLVVKPTGLLGKPVREKV